MPHTTPPSEPPYVTGLTSPSAWEHTALWEPGFPGMPARSVNRHPYWQPLGPGFSRTFPRLWIGLSCFPGLWLGIQTVELFTQQKPSAAKAPIPALFLWLRNEGNSRAESAALPSRGCEHSERKGTQSWGLPPSRTPGTSRAPSFSLYPQALCRPELLSCPCSWVPVLAMLAHAPLACCPPWPRPQQRHCFPVHRPRPAPVCSVHPSFSPWPPPLHGPPCWP